MKNVSGNTLWLAIAIVLSVCPIGFFPAMLSALPEESTSMLTLLVKLYPVAVLGYALCAWLCRRDRLTLAWILGTMSLLTSAALVVPLFMGLAPYAA